MDNISQIDLKATSFTLWPFLGCTHKESKTGFIKIIIGWFNYMAEITIIWKMKETLVKSLLWLSVWVCFEEKQRSVSSFSEFSHENG